MSYETVIGLEVHVELATASKMFCGCSTAFGRGPNSQTCPVCLGLPGALPVINRKAIEYAIKTGMALNCEISRFTKFDRKHYFYPDLPKNFQISQYDKPICAGGFLEISPERGRKKIGIKRVHLEEDAGKLIHQEGSDFSLVDYNRCGMPLIEIVSQPDINSPTEAHEYLVKLKAILQYLEVSDCNMEEGHLRCDANISIRPRGQAELGVKVELKNMNSFKGVRQALAHEEKRQAALLDEKSPITQETRLWDTARGATISMRTKEEAHDYRYFPEPDLMPVVQGAKMLDEIKRSLPELPEGRKKRFCDNYGLSDYDADVLTKEKILADFFEATLKGFSSPKVAANWIMGDLAGILNEKGISVDKISFKPSDLSDMLNLIERGAISAKMGKDLLREAIETGERPAAIVKNKGLTQISDETAIRQIAEKVLEVNPKTVSDFKSGKEAALTFLVGQVMKETKGKANPKVVNELLKKILKG